MRRARTFLARLSCILLLSPAFAQAQGTLEDYRRAATANQRFNGMIVGVVPGGVTWIGNTHQFSYRVSTPAGFDFVVVDATTGAKRPAFDHERLATALSAAAGASFTATRLPFTTFTFVDGATAAIEAEANNARWRCTITDYVCTRTGAAQGGGGFGPGGGRGGAGGPAGAQNLPAAIASRDRTMEACVRNYNVVVRAAPRAGAPARPCAEDATATLLSTDGSEGDAYQLRSLEWAPDGKRLVAYRRRPGYPRIVHFVRSSPADQVQPKHETTNTLGNNPNAIYQKPGDLLDFNQPVLFDVATGTQTIIDRTWFPNPYSISRPVWRDDSRAYTFEYNQRGHATYRVLEVNAANGAVRPVINEETKSFFAYRPASAGLSDTGHRYRYDIDDGREIIWMSERDGWAHLYLYDGNTGRVKQQITKGEWLVKSVDSVDVAQRQIYFRALGMNKDQDPYFVHFYRINFDGTGLVAYTEANGTHDISWSRDRQYYVDIYSRVDLPTVVELRRASDRHMTPLEQGDMSAAIAAGFRPPEVFVAKARDGKTDIWGIIVRPHTFDATRKYPVIEQIYAGPQGSFVPKAWGGGQNLAATAELGFVLVQIDGMGTNNRSKAFHDVAWKNLGDAGFPDRILWHKAVNAKYAWYDIERVGVYGSSAGGQNAAGAVLFHGDFYDAAFASSGCHDNRMDKIWWNEHWMGELGPHYAAQSNVTNAHRLKGKLFLAVGELDTNVDPASTLQVVDALIRARKDFDLLVVPNGGHGATGPDGTRRRNDFFVRHLLGVHPPDWNAGVTVATPNSTGLPEEPVAPYGFFEDPTDGAPPFWWW